MRRLVATLACLLAGLPPYCLALEIEQGVVLIRLGSADDASPSLSGPSIYLQGDGYPLAQAFQAQIDATASAPVDVVVVSASFASRGNSQTGECDLIIQLRNVNSCETVITARVADADSAAAAAVVDRAEIVYFSGGNQCEYVRWADGALYQALRRVGPRGGGIGGGSAGNAVQGDTVYDACTGSVESPAALANPYDPAIHFSYEYLDSLALADFVTDTHFVERNRMGRLISFVARQRQEGTAVPSWGLGVDAGAGVVIDALGQGQVYGGLAYVLLAEHAPQQCLAGEPLDYLGLRVWRLDAGSRFDFAGRSTAGDYLVDVQQGHIRGNPYRP